METEAEQRARVVAIARSYIGTPYHHAGTLKGVGVDCATLLALVFQDAGLIEPVPIPKYSPQWHLHRKVERYRDTVLERAHAIDVSAVGPGDVVLYHWGHVKAHGGIVTELGWPSIIHAYSRARFVVAADGTAGELGGREVEFFSYW